MKKLFAIFTSTIFILAMFFGFGFIQFAKADDCTADDIGGGITLDQISPNYNSAGNIISITYNVQPDNGSAGTHCTNSMATYITPNAGSGNAVMIGHPDPWIENTEGVQYSSLPTGTTSVSLDVQFQDSSGNSLTDTQGPAPILVNQNGAAVGSTNAGVGSGNSGGLLTGGSNTTATSSGTNTTSGGSPTTGSTTSSTPVQNVTLNNPISVNNIPDFVGVVIQYILGLIASVALVMIVIAGFRLVINSGNEKATTEARRMITNAILGLAVSLLAYTIIAIISGALKSPLH